MALALMETVEGTGASSSSSLMSRSCSASALLLLLVLQTPSSVLPRPADGTVWTPRRRALSGGGCAFAILPPETTTKNPSFLPPPTLPLPSSSLHNHHGFLHRRRSCSSSSPFPSSVSSSLYARRKKQQQQEQDLASFNAWYDRVDDDASPDDVYWEEMERQRLLSEASGSMGGGGGIGGGQQQQQQQQSGIDMLQSMSNPGGGIGVGGGMGGVGGVGRGMTPEEEKSVESTLASYATNMVKDNWLDDSLLEYATSAWDGSEDEEVDMEEEKRRLDEQIDEILNEGIEEGGTGDEPWDHWGAQEDEEEDEVGEEEVGLKVAPGKASEFLLTESESEDDALAAALEEEKYMERLSWITISSSRLNSAKDNVKAQTYFAREPDVNEGYDRMWVSAIDPVCVKNLVGVFRNYGVQFADNFGDWVDGSLEDGLRSIEDIASFKARKVFEVTGLPCVASRTSFEVEPAGTPPSMMAGGGGPGGGGGTATGGPGGGGGATSRQANNPRVLSGYRFNDIGDHVDYVIEALKPLSDPNRVTRFRSCLCFYDGNVEVFDYGECDVDIYFANSLRTFIPMSTAINEMCKTLQLTFGLEFQKWLKSKVREAMGGSYGGASLNLRDRVLKEGKVLPNDIIDVSEFMDSKVDVNLMDECGEELAKRFMEQKPTKILTVATTGLVIAIPMAKYLQVPVVYARKERNIVMADTFRATYSSKTVGKNRELLVSKSHLDETDRVLIVDDFLSSGSSQEALLRIVSDSEATAVGVGVLLEKVYESGRQSLSGYNVPVQSMVRIASVRNGIIQLLEEEGVGSVVGDGT